MKTLILMLSLLSFTAFPQQIEVGQGTFKWIGTKTGGSHYGKIMPKMANVNTDGKKIKNALVVMDMNSMTVDDISGKMAESLLGHLKNQDFFETSKYPTSTLELTSFDGSTAKGDLTIKGIKKPVTVSYKVEGNKINGKMVFDRTDYGIQYKAASGFFSKIKSFFGSTFIHNDVTVEFSLPIIQ